MNRRQARAVGTHAYRICCIRHTAPVRAETPKGQSEHTGRARRCPPPPLDPGRPREATGGAGGVGATAAGSRKRIHTWSPRAQVGKPSSGSSPPTFLALRPPVPDLSLSHVFSVCFHSFPVTAPLPNSSFSPFSSSFLCPGSRELRLGHLPPTLK